MGTLRDGYSGFRFYQALEPQDFASGAKYTGIAIDRRGFETVTFILNVGDNTGGGAFTAQYWEIMLEHYNSTAGAWSEVPPSQILHSVAGAGGAYSTRASGVWLSVTSANQSQTHAVGYKGPRRSVRIALSDVNAASNMSFGAIAILGLPADWPISTPNPE